MLMPPQCPQTRLHPTSHQALHLRERLTCQLCRLHSRLCGPAIPRHALGCRDPLPQAGCHHLHQVRALAGRTLAGLSQCCRLLDHKCLPLSACTMASCLFRLLAHALQYCIASFGHTICVTELTRYRSISHKPHLQQPSSFNTRCSCTVELSMLCMCRRHARWLPGRFRWAIDAPDAVQPGRRVDERWWFPEVIRSRDVCGAADTEVQVLLQ